MSEFGKVLGEVLAEKKVTKAELARRLGVSPQAVNGMVAVGNPTSKRLAQIAEALDLAFVDIARLVKSTAKPST
jgi:transcriptional regulator with XRE-family HTH domain